MALGKMRRILDPVIFINETIGKGLPARMLGFGVLKSVTDEPIPTQIYADFEVDGKTYRIQSFPYTLTLTEKLPDGEE